MKIFFPLILNVHFNQSKEFLDFFSDKDFVAIQFLSKYPDFFKIFFNQISKNKKCHDYEFEQLWKQTNSWF